MNDNVYTEYGVVTKDSAFFNKEDVVHQITGIDMEDMNGCWLVAKAGSTNKKPITQCKLTRIPRHFWAYVKDNTYCHNQKGKIIEMIFDEYDEKEDELFVRAKGYYIPIRGIDLSTISLTDPSITNAPTISSIFTMADLDGYTISVNGETITMSNKQGIEVSNVFGVDVDFGYALHLVCDAIREAEKKEEENVIKVGDKVKVIDAGKNYSTFKEKVVELISDPMLLCKYVYGNILYDSHDKDGIFIVRYIDEDYAYIEHNINGGCRLVTAGAITKCHKEEEDLKEEDNY